ncbi:hypothetical protein Barb7_00902 [Bacteroidales bacterium Barb7]|nr:hypothetical protein Barb7_00902 [Bacteroidales bacterium Barb7]
MPVLHIAPVDCPDIDKGDRVVRIRRKADNSGCGNALPVAAHVGSLRYSNCCIGVNADGNRLVHSRPDALLPAEMARERIALHLKLRIAKGGVQKHIERVFHTAAYLRAGKHFIFLRPFQCIVGNIKRTPQPVRHRTARHVIRHIRYRRIAASQTDASTGVAVVRHQQTVKRKRIFAVINQPDVAGGRVGHFPRKITVAPLNALYDGRCPVLHTINRIRIHRSRLIVPKPLVRHGGRRSKTNLHILHPVNQPDLQAVARIRKGKQRGSTPARHRILLCLSRKHGKQEADKSLPLSIVVLCWHNVSLIGGKSTALYDFSFDMFLQSSYSCFICNAKTTKAVYKP